ncbi:hypothetical protein R3P38DRAFT_3295108 [Favolaschia claudopus]|uniref:Uncharacterized protein n=1 Tax=Favolaschia claudopus TaxID=2862362 RepID=A0AAV9ZBE9_9AGAR
MTSIAKIAGQQPLRSGSCVILLLAREQHLLVQETHPRHARRPHHPSRVPSERIDYLMIILAAVRPHATEGPGPNAKWCEAYVINQFSQHYLVHLLRDKLIASASRLVFVSSGAVNMVKHPTTLSTVFLANSGAAPMTAYPASKLARPELTGNSFRPVSSQIVRGMPSATSKSSLQPEAMKDTKGIDAMSKRVSTI